MDFDILIVADLLRRRNGRIEPANGYERAKA